MAGRPLAGVARARLDRALAAAGVEWSAVYVTNVVLCHPERDSVPTPRAVSACHGRLIHEVSERRAKKVLALGSGAAKALTGDSRIKVMRLARPAPSPFLDGDAEVRVTYHPAAALRDPRWSEPFDADLGWLGELWPRTTRPMRFWRLLELVDRNVGCSAAICRRVRADGVRLFSPRTVTICATQSESTDKWPTFAG
jgi:uracil-DNA glycosylase family 4